MRDKLIKLVAVVAFVAIAALPANAPARASSAKGKTINTAIGPLVIDKVKITHQFKGYQADPGLKLLIVKLRKRDNKKLSNSEGERFMELKDSYIVGSDGAQADQIGNGFRSGPGKSGPGKKGNLLWVGFTPAESANQFKLFWPENPPIDLGK